MPNASWLRSSRRGQPKRRPSTAKIHTEQATKATENPGGFEFRKGQVRYALEKADPLALLCMSIQAEASNVARVVAELELQKIHMTHSTVREFYSWLGEIVWIIEACVKCAFDVVLTMMRNMSAERKEARNSDYLAALERLDAVQDSQLAFENCSLPPGERFIVIQRARDILLEDLMKSLAEVDHEASNSDQEYREDRPGGIEIAVYNALEEQLSAANKTKKKAADVAAGVLTQWMTDAELQQFKRKAGGVLTGSRLRSTRDHFRDERIKSAYLLAVSAAPAPREQALDSGRIEPEMVRQLNGIAAQRLRSVINEGVAEEDLAGVALAPDGCDKEGEGEKEGAGVGDRARPERLMPGTWNAQQRGDRGARTGLLERSRMNSFRSRDGALGDRERRDSVARRGSMSLRRVGSFHQSIGRRGSFSASHGRGASADVPLRAVGGQ